MTKSRNKIRTEHREKARLSTFARRLLNEWKRLELTQTSARAVIAVSGGADSVALLLGVDELLKAGKLRVDFLVAHLDHQLRETSRADARWVKALAKRLGYSATTRSMNVSRRAAIDRDNLEQAARRARYAFLSDVARKERAQIVLTGHTLDDQAETVLLNLLRGSGSDGLSGMKPVRPLSEVSKVALVRPMLSWARRSDTENYCRSRGNEFLSDEMNCDKRFARVRVRRDLLPLMASFNPKIVDSLARAAELAREDSAVLEKAAAALLHEAQANHQKPSHKRARQLRVKSLLSAEPALRRRALRQWISECRGDLKRVERVHILAVEGLLFGDHGGRVIELPGGTKIARKRGALEYRE